MTSTPHAFSTDFPPTLREVMLRPWWLGMLGVALIVAAIFAWLGQWQLGNAIDTDPPPPGLTEQLRPLTEVVEPGEYLPEPLVGQRVSVDGEWVPGDFLVVSARMNQEQLGYWVTGQLRTAEDTAIAVAVGWAAERADADAAASALNATPPTGELTGRIISDEGAQLPPREAPFEMVRMSPAMLLGQWHDAENLTMYRPYLASATAPAGLSDIHSPPPVEGTPVNWLNIFYAAEWAVFAGFAFYMWYRLARDAWEREVEAFDDAAVA